jgi:RPA family protein
MPPSVVLQANAKTADRLLPRIIEPRIIEDAFSEVVYRVKIIGAGQQEDDEDADRAMIKISVIVSTGSRGS